MKKKFIVSGCSFTADEKNWPTPTSEILDLELINVGMGSQGNVLISKKLIYAVEQELKTTKAEDILVGIMWSGIDRHDIYVDRYEKCDMYENMLNIDGWVENPTKVVDGNYNWLVLNHWKTDKVAKWYREFHTDAGSTIYTIQSILLTQLFLEKRNIKYFMTTFMNIFIKDVINNPDVKYLYDIIDFDKFVPIDGCYEWVKRNYSNEFEGVFHPNRFSSKKFAEEIIIPFINEKKLF